MASIPVESIRIDGGTQPRSAIDEAVVAEYAEAMEAGATFPPVKVFWDGVDYWLGDGFHRVHAARRTSREDIEADRENGTKRDAVLHSVGANSDHGLRRTNADKYKAVMTLLEDGEWSRWSDREIARQCSVSPSTVASYREGLSVHLDRCEPPTTRTVERSGTIYQQDTTNIGKREVEPANVEPEEAAMPTAEAIEKNQGKARVPSRPSPNCGKIVSALKDLSECMETGEALYRAATDNQRASIREDIKHARTLINQLHGEIFPNEHS